MSTQLFISTPREPQHHVDTASTDPQALAVQHKENALGSHRLELLTGCINRLGAHSSLKLLAIQQLEKTMLKDGIRATTHGQLHDSEKRQQTERKSALSKVHTEKEIFLCAKKLSTYVQLSDRVSAAIPGTNIRPRIQSILVQLVYNAVRTGHYSYHHFPLTPDHGPEAKLSCHCSPNSIPEITLRWLITETPKKTVFALSRLDTDSSDPIVVYSKVKKELFQRSTFGYLSQQRSLEQETAHSSTFHSSQQSDGQRHIIHMKNVFRRKDPRTFKGVVMEYGDMGDVSGQQPPTADQYIWRILIAYQVAQALHTIHAHNYCHLDVKPENIFLKNNSGNPVALLGDLEYCMETGRGCNTLFGTTIFLPPEVFMEASWKVTPFMDMWSFGLTLLELSHGEDANLFSLETRDDLFSQPRDVILMEWKTIHGKMLATLDPLHPVDLLIRDLLTFSPPDARPSAQQTAIRLRDIIESL